MYVFFFFFFFFFDLVISGALTLLQEDFHMTNVQKELVVGATTFGAIFGGFFSGLVSFIFGKIIKKKKKCLIPIFYIFP
jgi:SP family myo-inositol transporter-like MFS transporter 13